MHYFSASFWQVLTRLSAFLCNSYTSMRTISYNTPNNPSATEYNNKIQQYFGKNRLCAILSIDSAAVFL